VSTPVERALEERARLGLSSKAPTPDLLGLIENVAKVPVIVQQLGPTGIAGAYAVRRGLPFIFVNGSMPTVRARFTLAHEYGHHVLQHGLSIDKVINISGKQPPKEVEANSFAAEFLLPLEALDAWLRDRDYPDADLNVVVELARDFWVSALVACYRLLSAHRLSSKKAIEIEHAIEQGQHLQVRLPDTRLLPESLVEARGRVRRLPAEAEYALLRALDQGLLSEEDVEAKLQVPRDELQAFQHRLAVNRADEI